MSKGEKPNRKRMATVGAVYDLAPEPRTAAEVGSGVVLLRRSRPRRRSLGADRAMAVLQGKAGDVAAGIRRRATTAGLAAQRRKKADEAARYLTNKAPLPGLPDGIGSRVAHRHRRDRGGACRHLVKDRMDITGARWSVAGAEAVLKLRAVRCNGDFDAYWRWHLAQERRRVHESRYAEGAIPAAA